MIARNCLPTFVFTFLLKGGLNQVTFLFLFFGLGGLPGIGVKFEFVAVTTSLQVIKCSWLLIEVLVLVVVVKGEVVLVAVVVAVVENT